MLDLNSTKQNTLSKALARKFVTEDMILSKVKEEPPSATYCRFDI